MADAFRLNFERGDLNRPEMGAAFGLYADGELVVDLWAGTADSASAKPWDENTLALVFSTTKGATAICVGLAEATVGVPAH